MDDNHRLVDEHDPNVVAAAYYASEPLSDNASQRRPPLS